MNFLSRRCVLSQLLVGASAHVLETVGYSLTSAQSKAGQELPVTSSIKVSDLIMSFMDKFDVPGVCVAVSRSQTLIYQQSFGISDVQTGARLTDSHLFRIASVTKPLTSTAVFSLIQANLAKLSDTVFGANGVLGTKYGAGPYGKYVEQITIGQLLTHTAGGWPNDSTDPMSRFRDLSHDELIAWAIHNVPLATIPGTHWAYSNFGYCILGRVVEKLCGREYGDYVRKDILLPCGIIDMTIGGDTPRERLPSEVAYYGQSENPYSINVRRMDANGGWLATATDLVQFASQLHKILEPGWIETMLKPSSVYAGYANGWSVDARGASHNGSLPGTTTDLIRDDSGLCCAVLTNTRRQPREVIDRELRKRTLEIADIFSGA
jgi:CubicO group peptidase (beta-lactamase class C family)